MTGRLRRRLDIGPCGRCGGSGFDPGGPVGTSGPDWDDLPDPVEIVDAALADIRAGRVPSAGHAPTGPTTAPQHPAGRMRRPVRSRRGRAVARLAAVGDLACGACEGTGVAPVEVDEAGRPAWIGREVDDLLAELEGIARRKHEARARLGEDLWARLVHGPLPPDERLT